MELDVDENMCLIDQMNRSRMEIIKPNIVQC